MSESNVVRVVRSFSPGVNTTSSRYRRYGSSPSKNVSMVIQNGPAFFDRTCEQTSRTLGTSDLRFGDIDPPRAHERHGIVDPDDVIHPELEHLPALDLGG